MKRIIRSFSLFAFGRQPIVAQPIWFAAAAVDLTFIQNQATCVIANTGTLLMFCSVQAAAQLANGRVLHAYVNDVMQPEQVRHAYVYSYPPSVPIIAAGGDGRCHF